MDSQDHSKIHSLGHENHVCHKCGWTFPNPHPSSKTRRAHKRVCGKIEKTHLVVSDEEQLSDEEHKSPEGSKMEERRSNEKGVGGITREGSNRSEDEEFSDAVAEFADTGSVRRTEMLVVESVKGPDTNDQSVKATASATSNPMHGSQIQNLQALECSTHQVGCETLFQDHASSSTIGLLATSISDKLTGSLAVEPSNETPVNASSENTNTHTGEDVMDSSRAFAGQDMVAKGNETTKVDGNLPYIAVTPSKTASEASEEDSKLQEMDGFAGVEILPDVTNAGKRIFPDTVPNDRIADSKEEQIDDLGTKISQIDPFDSCSRSTGIESVEHTDAFIEPSPDSCSQSTEVESIEVQRMGAFVDNAQVEADTAQKIDTLGDTVEGFNVKGEVNENVHAISVPDDIHLEAHHKIMVQDFKDHGPVKSELSATLESGEALRDLEDHNKTPVSEETNSGFLSSKSDEGADVSSSAMEVSEDILQQESRASKNMVEEVSVKCEADISEAKVVISEHVGSDGLEAFPDATRSDIKLNDTEKSQTVCSLDEQEPRDFYHDLSCKILPENGTLVVAGIESRKEGTEENDTVNMRMTPESAGDPSASQFHANGEIMESESLQENKSKPLDTVADASGIGINTSRLGNITETHSNLQNAWDEDFQEGAKELDLSSRDSSSVSKKEVQVQCIGADSSITDVGFFQRGSENRMLKEPMPSAVDAEPGVLTSVEVRNNSSRDSGGDVSGNHSESLQEEGDNLIKQQLGASAVLPADISVDSNSQSDSLEGYWGSVSDGTVPSTRYATDAPPVLDVVALPPTNSKAPKKEARKSNLLKTRDASKEHISDNPDIFEAPSFMTLVEPGRGNDREAASSEIQTVQNPKKPNSSSIQAGWFPSLTNVVNESQGRKKNEDIIAKVVNWSSGKPHTPLKNLLVEANLESKQRASNSQRDLIPATHKDEGSAQENVLPAKTLPSMPIPEVLNTPATKRDSGKEWNSPARLPDSKRDKRKVKGKPYWVPFVCCSSVN